MLSNVYASQTVKKYTDVIIICGRYEGIDARVKKGLKVLLPKGVVSMKSLSGIMYSLVENYLQWS